jgi:hypothetical protein
MFSLWLTEVLPASSSGSTPRHAHIVELGLWFAAQQARGLAQIKQGFSGLHGKVSIAALCAVLDRTVARSVHIISYP